jgi:hypothetical protein
VAAAAAWGYGGVGGGGSVAGIPVAALLWEVRQRQYGGGGSAVMAEWQRGGGGIAVVAAWQRGRQRSGSGSMGSAVGSVAPAQRQQLRKGPPF